MAAQRRDDWSTPAWLVERLRSEFAFTVDAAASPCNAKVGRFWSVADDGLAQDWSGEVVWCNPPYGAGIAAWTAKARVSRALTVMLVPVRSESRWWSRDVLEADEIRFVRGRVHFDPPPDLVVPLGGSRPVFASAIVIWRGLEPRASRWRVLERAVSRFVPIRSGPVVSSFPTPRVAAAERQLELLMGR